MGYRFSIAWTNAGLFTGVLKTNAMQFESKYKQFQAGKRICICRIQNEDHFVSVSIC